MKRNHAIVAYSADKNFRAVVLPTQLRIEFREPARGLHWPGGGAYSRTTLVWGLVQKTPRPKKHLKCKDLLASLSDEEHFTLIGMLRRRFMMAP